MFITLVQDYLALSFTQKPIGHWLISISVFLCASFSVEYQIFRKCYSIE
ncbi:MAG: hypothetical protein Q4C95_04180 [Planctomycetia bacterium]|nr:hypothetical protein [Planctomycetia bacterium]